MTPLLSIIIPTHNRRELLIRALDALRMQDIGLDQCEVIVVCDGCSDGSAEAVREMARTWPSLRVIEQANAGPARARNAGSAAARSSLLAFTDDDCTAAPSWASNMVRAFDDRTVVAVEGCTVSDRTLWTPLTHQVVSAKASGWLITCNAACRAVDFNAVGGFECAFPFPHSEDLDLAWRLSERGRILFGAQSVVVHPPRPETFVKKATWVRYLQSEFLLARRHPQRYRAHAGPSPWYTIYWNVFVVGQFCWLRSWVRYLVHPFKPSYFLMAIAVSAARCVNLIRYFPDYHRASQAFSPVRHEY